jgi:hypothetical protein
MAGLISFDLDEVQKNGTRLSFLLDKGIVEQNGCYFLRYFFPRAHVSHGDFIDKTGCECFINSFHIDDYIDDHYLEEAFSYVFCLFEQWKAAHNSLRLKAIIAGTDSGANVRFHVIRDNERWVDEENLEQFEEGICILSL